MQHGLIEAPHVAELLEAERNYLDAGRRWEKHRELVGSVRVEITRSPRPLGAAGPPTLGRSTEVLPAKFSGRVRW